MSQLNNNSESHPGDDLKRIDTLISAKHIVPVAPANKVFTDCGIAVDKGRIIDIKPQSVLDERYNADKRYDLGDQVLMPGLVNAHGHAAMSLLRGYADDLPLMTWLQEHIWPAESQWVNEDFVTQGAELAIAEMLLSGTTCFSDMYFFPNLTAQTAFNSGIRAQIVFPVLDFPTIWAADADEYIHKGLELHDSYRSKNRVSIGFGPHAPYTLSDAPLKRIRMLADEMQAPVQIHLHETAFEVAESLKNVGKRPVQRLADIGFLTPLVQCVHMTQLNDDDIQSLIDTGASIVHCPESNLKLASGLCPVQTLLDKGITVGLGTDGAASNNDLDMFGELSSAAMIGKIAADSASAITAFDALHMATLGGAKALGIDQHIGSLEVGKVADIIALDIDVLSTMPMHSLISTLVYSNRQLTPTHSWVDGKLLMKDRQLLTMNIEKIRIETAAWQAKLKKPN